MINEINNIKYMKYSKDKQCMIRYHTNSKGYTEYWYNDLYYKLKDYEFIIIDSFVLPMEKGSIIGINFLKEFCNIMTIQNKIVIIDTEEFIKYLENECINYGYTYYDACTDILDEMLYNAGFDVLRCDHSYLYKDVYLYTKSRLGMNVYNIIENFYDLTEEE